MRDMSPAVSNDSNGKTLYQRMRRISTQIGHIWLRITEKRWVMWIYRGSPIFFKANVPLTFIECNATRITARIFVLADIKFALTRALYDRNHGCLRRGAALTAAWHGKKLSKHCNLPTINFFESRPWPGCDLAIGSRRDPERVLEKRGKERAEGRPR